MMSSDFNFPIMHGETVSITPIKGGYTFTPSSYSVRNNHIGNYEVTFRVANRSAEAKTSKVITDKEDYLGPNPFNTQVNLTINLEDETEVHLEIYDAVKGSLIDEKFFGNQTGSFTGVYPTNHLPKGLYILKCKAGDKVIIKKMIKN